MKVVGCAVFRAEAEHVLGEAARQIEWISPGLHVDLGRLERVLDERLGSEGALCLLAGCHPALDRLLHERGGRRLPGKDCIAVFIDEEERKRLEGRLAFVMTPGWLDHWREIFQEALGWDGVDARQSFGLYDTIVLLDFGLAPIDDMALLEFFEFVQVPIEVMSASLDRFREAIWDLLELPSAEAAGPPAGEPSDPPQPTAAER